MPGTEEVTVTIGGKTWTLIPPKGLRAIKYMPKVLSVLSEWVYIAMGAGIPLGDLLDGSMDEIPIHAILKAIAVIADKIGDRYDELAAEIFPQLLQCTKEFLATEGTPHEILTALWVAIKFHFPFIFGSDVGAALKKSVVDTEKETEQTLEEVASTQSET